VADTVTEAHKALCKSSVLRHERHDFYRTHRAVALTRGAVRGTQEKPRLGQGHDDNSTAPHEEANSMHQGCRPRYDWGQWGARILRRLEWNGSGMPSSCLRFAALLLLVPSLGGISAVLPVLPYNDVGVSDSAPSPIAALPGPLYPEQLEALVDGGPCAIAVADLNADGHLDLVTANAASDDVTVWFGTGTGTFQAPQHFPVGVAPVAMAVADLNADGHLDLITVNAASGNVTVLLGTGTGTFQAPRHFPTGIAPATITVADLNADDHPDLLITNAASPDVTVLLGTGTGAFQSPRRFSASRCTMDPVQVSVDAQSHTARATVDDPSGDGIALLGLGEDTFQVPRCIANGRPATTMLADLNADGHQDLIAIRPASGDLMVLLSTAEGTYQPPQYFFTSERGPATVTPADLNADGHPDRDTIPEPSVALPTSSSVALQTSSPASWEPRSATELLQGYFPAK
jgi:hypothetical protein